MKSIPSVLFVCMGNICRSPSAEIIWKSKLSKKLGNNNFICDSAGTISYHVGSPPDSRMQQALVKEGYKPFGISRKLKHQDLCKFDLILSMDYQNNESVMKLTQGDPHLIEKCHLFCEFSEVNGYSEIPDPYYGGTEGFRNVIKMIEEGCDNMIIRLS